MKRVKALAMPVMAGMFAVVFAAPAWAVDDLSLNVTPPTSVEAGATVTVTLDVANLSAAINGVQIRVQYDTSLMTLIDVVPNAGPGWTEVSQSNTSGAVNWAAVINAGSTSANHTMATLTFTAIATGSSNITFRADAAPFFTKLTRASDNGTILPNKTNSGTITIGCNDGLPCTTDVVIAQVCQHNLEPAGTLCRASTGVCDPAETCNGLVGTCPADALSPAGTTCRVSAGVCDPAETCTGSATTCPADALSPAGTSCRASTGACDPAETCTGSAAACPADVITPSGTVCRTSTGVCDPAETCNGVSGACPADALSPAGTTCRVSAGVCDPAETCTGSSAACPADALTPAGTECRASTGACDPAETCTGSAAACPSDVLLANGTVCRASAGICDPQEVCNGVAGACPPDALSVAGTLCRGSAGVCDVAETCTGSAATCPADGFQSSATPCRASTGVCDPVENCTGSAAACPADLLSPAGTVCAASTGPCDPAETCTGAVATCPANALSPAGTECNASTGPCDPAETCTGASAACPANLLSPAGTLCRAVAGVCDVQETCTGSAASCPTDGFLSAGTGCRAVAGICDVAESCTGSAAACPADGFLSSATLCRSSTGPCDPLENCSGSAAACPTDVINGQVLMNLKAQAVGFAVTRDVTFVLTDCGGVVVTRVVPVSFDVFGNGVSTLASLPGNEDWVAVSEGHTLRRLTAVSYAACSASVDLSGTRLLLSGDFNTASVAKDNLVDVVDFSILASRWNQAISAGSSLGADATADGIQGMADFTAIQVNFFIVGEALDGCPFLLGEEEESGRGREWEAIEVGSKSEPYAAVAVDRAFPETDRADMNRDGVVDVRDIRSFARRQGLRLLPEFEKKLEMLENRRTSGRRGR